MFNLIVGIWERSVVRQDFTKILLGNFEMISTAMRESAEQKLVLKEQIIRLMIEIWVMNIKFLLSNILT